MRHAIVLTLSIFCVAPGFAEPSVLVTLAPARRGSTPVTITAYGQAAPASTAVRTITLAQTGQVTAVRVTVGQAVRRGAPLLTFAVAPTAVAGYRQAQTAVTLAMAQQLHARQLLAGQLGTKDQLATADKAVADAQAQLAALAREGAGEAVTPLTAPFDGVVTSLPVAAGDRPAAGAPLATLARASGVQVTVGIEPGSRSQVRVGEAAELKPVGGGPSVQGRVIRVDAALNPRSRLIDVDVSAPAGAVFVGQAFQALIAVASHTGWLVPHAAVRVEDGEAAVFQIAGGKAHRVRVTVAQPGRETDVVEGVLDPARPVAVEGAAQLDDGAAVRTR